jgi:hypothetical protein
MTTLTESGTIMEGIQLRRGRVASGSKDGVHARIKLKYRTQGYNRDHVTIMAFKVSARIWTVAHPIGERFTKVFRTGSGPFSRWELEEYLRGIRREADATFDDFVEKFGLTESCQ